MHDLLRCVLIVEFHQYKTVWDWSKLRLVRYRAKHTPPFIMVLATYILEFHDNLFILNLVLVIKYLHNVDKLTNNINETCPVLVSLVYSSLQF